MICFIIFDGQEFANIVGVTLPVFRRATYFETKTILVVSAYSVVSACHLLFRLEKIS